MVLVHGTLEDYRTWDGQLEAFSKGYRLISYSRRYHYPNEWPKDATDFSVTLHARDLAAFIKALNLPPVHLVGHSYGAFIALLVARDHPEVIRSLRRAGYRVPDDVGVAYHTLDEKSLCLSGMKKNSFQIGEMAVDLLIDMLHRNERGVPVHPYLLMVEGSWVEGNTLRPAPASTLGLAWV